MPFACPYCSHSINVKSAKPGKYKPKCPRCSQVILLTVPEGDAAPIAQKLPEAKPEPPKPKAAPPADDVTQMTAEFDIPKKTEDDDATQVIKSLQGPAKPPADNEDATQITSEFENPPAAERTMAAPTRPAKTQVGRRAQRGDDDFAVSPPADVPETIGGYRVISELGRGGMGAVYLAQQISLDRPVALKVMNPSWGSDPAFVARFTREAYAAAQLVHHNIVQIYDFGEDHKLHYFSMEYVDGKSLADLVKKKGKLDPEEAIGYTLQAARGLKFAHDRGMIHRDIKPDNLMLNSQGVVKVADLGLVKTPGLQEPPATSAEPKKERSKIAESATTAVTRVGIAMGTPAYMSPEQARDATQVDHRADIYSLGCTLYVLLTGKPPFEGRTVMELFTKHATQPIVPPDTIVKRVPKELSTIIQKMVAKKPEDRYADMGAVAKALEEWLGVKGGDAGGEIVTEEHVSQLESAVQRFNTVPLAGLRGILKISIFGGSILLAVLFLLLSLWKLGLASLLLSVETMTAYFLVSAFLRPDALTVKVREFLMESRWKERIQAAVALFLILAVLFVAGIFWHWLGFTLVAVGLAFGLHFGIDRMVESSRIPAIEEAEELFKKLRLRGIDEEALRQFACKYGGNQWEEFYETMFGFDEKLLARDWWVRGQKGQARQKYAAWREPMIRWLDRKLSARRAERERAALQQLEAKRLEAEGVSRGEARAKAEHTAGVLVQHAAELRAEAKAPAPEGEPLRRPRPIAAIILEEPAQDDAPRKSAGLGTLVSRFVNLVFGPTLRFLLGAVLVAGALFWIFQNELYVDAQKIQGLGDLKRVALAQHKVDPNADTYIDARPLNVAGITLSFFDSYSPLIAGFLLILSSLRSSLVTAVLMPLVAMFMVFGPKLGVPSVGPVSASHLCLAVGSLVGVAALAIFRERHR